MIKQWNVKCDGRGLENSEIINEIIDSRGIEDLTHFLNPVADDLIDFEKLKNIEKAYEIIDDTLAMNGKFLVYADVDVDGCTACAIMYRYLSRYTCNVEYLINDGKKHGIEEYNVSDCDVDTVIIVDSINTSDTYKKFTDKGIQVIILDHHIVPEGFDFNAVTLVSSANDYENPNLSGSGVVWKFCAYCDYMNLTDYADNLIDLAACGIVADMCDLSEASAENRYICSRGFSDVHNTGIKKINGSYAFNAQAVSFGIAPLVNAAQRLNKNEEALRLFLSDNEDEIKEIIKTLKKAKETQNEIVAELMPTLYEQAEKQNDSKMLVFIVNTEQSVSGLLGNKLCEIYQKPVLVLKLCDDEYRGSARGIGLDNFKAVLDDTGLIWTGGHENACGVIVEKKNLDDLITAVNLALKNVEFINKKDIDIQLNVEQINSELIDMFKQVNTISGIGFPTLTVMIDNITDYEVGDMSKGKHLKLTVDSGDLVLIKWNYMGDFSEFDSRPLKIVGKLDSSFFGRRFTKQVILDDWEVK